MRKGLAIIAAVCVSSGSIAASADHFLVIKGVAAQDGHTYLKVQSGDLDGDGVADEGVVRLQCSAGQLRAAHYYASRTRYTSSGQSVSDGQGGKRTHHPVTFVKEWGATTPQLYQVKVAGHSKPTPKISKESHGRSAAAGWEPITLADTATICTAAQEAVRKATKTSSNIQNN